MNDIKARLAIYLLKKYFDIKFIVYKNKDNTVWCRTITIQGKEDAKYENWDTTAEAELTKEPREFYILKNIIEKEE